MQNSYGVITAEDLKLVYDKGHNVAGKLLSEIKENLYGFMHKKPGVYYVALRSPRDVVNKNMERDVVDALKNSLSLSELALMPDTAQLLKEEEFYNVLKHCCPEVWSYLIEDCSGGVVASPFSSEESCTLQRSETVLPCLG